ncbi:MAG: hypothetical protein NTW52_18050 [Planctomycetota bacterium]|nr:hypothetical protein [Planctomycetota bacterium]
MLEQTDHYQLEVHARQMAADSLGNIWFRGPLDEIFKHNLAQRTTEMVAFPNDAASFVFTSTKAVYGTWGGEIWSMDYCTRKAVMLLATPTNSPVVNLAVDLVSGMIFCSTKSEILGVRIDGAISVRLPIEFVEDILATGDRLWFVKRGRISLWNLKKNHLSMTSETGSYLLVQHAMNGMIAGLRGELDILSDDGRIIESVPGTINRIAWDERNCILGYANGDESINFCRTPSSVQSLDTYSVSNASAILSVQDFGFVVSWNGELLVFRNLV